MEKTLPQKLLDAGFLLGGSRRMAEKYPDAVHIKEGTDWDFYAQDTPANRAALKDMGLELLDAPNRDYWDDLLNDIFIGGTGAVQVLLRSDAELYRTVFERISAKEYVCDLWKSSPLRDDTLTKIQYQAKICARFNRMFEEPKDRTVFNDLTPF